MLLQSMKLGNSPGHGFQFSGDELKSISKYYIPGIKIKKKETSPTYSFGENGN